LTHTIAVVNMAWQRGRDQELLQAVLSDPRWLPDTAVLVEARDRRNRALNIRAMAPAEWDVYQSLRTSAHAGTVILDRRDHLPTTLRGRLIKASRRARNVQPRFIREVAFGRFHVLGGHTPLRTTGQQSAFLRRLARRFQVLRRRKRAWAYFGDFNRSPKRMASATGARNFVGVEVMGCLYEGVEVVEWGFKHYPSSDHPVLFVRFI
jgi:exonuclease III